MDQIHSKDIYYITCDVLKFLDAKSIRHGQRTAYILYRMLELTNKYEMFELAELAMLATLHDIGAYKTDYQQDMLKYETQDYMPHSIYGYLYISYLTPMKDMAKIILHHGTDFNRVPKSDYQYQDVIHILNVAEKMEIYSTALGEKFNYMVFDKYADTKFSAKALDLLYQAEKRNNIFAKLASGEYKSELDELMENLVFTNEEKKNWVFALMYIVGFRSEYTMNDVVTCLHISQLIGKSLMLSQKELDDLYYGAILHDAGMCAVPREIIEAPRKLTDEEYKSLRNHVMDAYDIMKGRVTPQILEIIAAHHERSDGSGYPKHLQDYQMNRSQRILQVADVVTALTNQRSYRPAKTKEQVIKILCEEAERGHLNGEVVRIVTGLYDRIMGVVKGESDKMLYTYRKLQENYDITLRQISGN